MGGKPRSREVAALRATLDQRAREVTLAYAAYWREASRLPSYKPYCDAWFRLAEAGGKWQADDGNYTPEGREVDMGAGYVFLMQAHELLSWKAYWDAHDRWCAASRAFCQAIGLPQRIRAAAKAAKRRRDVTGSV